MIEFEGHLIDAQSVAATERRAEGERTITVVHLIGGTTITLTQTPKSVVDEALKKAWK